MKDKERLLKDKLIELDTEYECSISAGTHREPDEISDDAKIGCGQASFW